LGGFPGGQLRDVLGIWAEEIDALYENDRNAIVFNTSNELGISGEYEVREYCDLIHTEKATSIGVYKFDFYAGRPACTVNNYGMGKAYYIAACPELALLSDFYGSLASKLDLKRSLQADLPYGVSAQVRSDGKNDYIFLMNFNANSVIIDLGTNTYFDQLTGAVISGQTILDTYNVKVLTLHP
jgi:beta-galactosidase